MVATLGAQPGFRTEGRLVLVNAGVYDDRNRFHPDLAKENFQLLDDGVEMPIATAGVEDVAISTVVLMDVSRSMAKDMAEAREALSRYLDQARQGDEFCFLAFNAHVPADCLFTRDAGKIRAMADAAEAAGGTALGDGLLTAMAMTRRASNPRRAVLILSDGLDNSSAHHWRDVHRAALETDAVLYAVGLPTWRDRDAWQSLRLQALTEETGGRMLNAGSVRELPAILERLEIRQQYVLAFAPPAGAEKKPRHTVRVRLRGAATHRLRVYWRHSYLAATP